MDMDITFANCSCNTSSKKKKNGTVEWVIDGRESSLRQKYVRSSALKLRVHDMGICRSKNY